MLRRGARACAAAFALACAAASPLAARAQAQSDSASAPNEQALAATRPAANSAADRVYGR